MPAPGSVAETGRQAAQVACPGPVGKRRPSCWQRPGGQHHAGLQSEAWEAPLSRESDSRRPAAFPLGPVGGTSRLRCLSDPWKVTNVEKSWGRRQPLTSGLLRGTPVCSGRALACTHLPRSPTAPHSVLAAPTWNAHTRLCRLRCIKVQTAVGRPRYPPWRPLTGGGSHRWQLRAPVHGTWLQGSCASASPDGWPSRHEPRRPW